MYIRKGLLAAALIFFFIFSKPAAAAVTDHPLVNEVKSVHQIQQAVWLGTDSARAGPGVSSEAVLDIAADGEIWDTALHNQANGGLQIDFNGMRLAPSAILPIPPQRGLVRYLRWMSVSPTTVRLQIDTVRRFIVYRTILSPDRRHFTIRLRPSPLTGQAVFLDPGHGGGEHGACGRQGTLEKENNLAIALRLKSLLEAAGAVVCLTRDDDTFIGLYERPYIANYLSADLFISIHTNYHPDPSVRGIEIYTFPGRKNAVPLARNVLDGLVWETGFDNLGRKENSFVVIREAQMPGILAEVGYLSNFDEETVIRAPEFIKKAATGIYAGIVNYLWPGT